MFTFNKDAMVGFYSQQELLQVSYLLIGGGGGGDGSGGGAGGVLQGTLKLGRGRYDVIIGQGGSAATANGNATRGGNSIFAGLTALGGGRGVYNSNNILSPGDGGIGVVGSGSGGMNGYWYPAGFGGVGTPNQGYNGGRGSGAGFQDATFTGMGGGGGAGGVGGDGGADGNTPNGQVGGHGGIGIISNITGFSEQYAGGGGGGGGDPSGTYHQPGQYGGGSASYGGGAGGNVGGALDALPNTGGGGGGIFSSYPAGNGGSGILVISYPGTTPKALGGTYQYTIGGNYVHVFYSSSTNTPPSIPPIGSLNDISGLFMWQDASDLGTITFNGKYVAQWNDKSGNGRHFVQTDTSHQPLYLTSNTSVGGRPALSINNTSVHYGMINARSSDFNNIQGTFTFIFVGKIITQYVTLMSQSGNTIPRRRFDFKIGDAGTGGTNSLELIHGTNDNTRIYTHPTPSSTYKVYVFAVNSSTSGTILTESTTLNATNSPTYSPLVFTGSVSNNLSLGYTDGFNLNGFIEGNGNFECTEIALYNRTLTSTEMNNIQAYYLAKYNALTSFLFIS